eukprot:150561-Amphidinium_carterae.1
MEVQQLPFLQGLTLKDRRYKERSGMGVLGETVALLDALVLFVVYEFFKSSGVTLSMLSPKFQ